MIQLRILEILEEQGQTKYWLFKQMNMSNYNSFQKLIENKTSSIRFDTLIKLSQILEVPVGKLFKHT
ncbi:MAG: helix-turn-helix domain-containing protein [Lachnospiraceae bacterium]|nr:helix-turn-helix domain-containing protein [Lachnospiraceae bacterium]